MAYSTDLRQRVIGYLEKGHTQEETASVFEVSVSAIKEWKRLLAETGKLSKRPLVREPSKYTSEKLTGILDEKPDAYLSEIAEMFEHGSVAGVHKALLREKLTRKKRRFVTKSVVTQRAKNT